MNRLAVVVLNWNGADLVEGCVASLARQSFKNFQIVVVDNNSTDNSRAVLEKIKKKIGKKLHVIYHHKNSGFAGGVNVGIDYALANGFDGVALLNNDAVADKQWLKNLSEVLTSKLNVGIVTGLLLSQDGQTIDSTGECYSIWGLSFPRSRDKKTATAPISGYVFGATGGASLYSAKMLASIGLFDETFFAYYEDIDISFRAQLSGWKVYYDKRAVAYHNKNTTTKKVPGIATYQTFKNLPLLFIKNVPATYWGIIGSRLFLAYLLMFFNTASKGAFWYALKGMLAAIYYKPSAIKQRRRILGSRKTDDAYLKSILWPSLPPQQRGMRKLASYFNGNYRG